MALYAPITITMRCKEKARECSYCSAHHWGSKAVTEHCLLLLFQVTASNLHLKKVWGCPAGSLQAAVSHSYPVQRKFTEEQLLHRHLLVTLLFFLPFKEDNENNRVLRSHQTYALHPSAFSLEHILK